MGTGLISEIRPVPIYRARARSRVSRGTRVIFTARSWTGEPRIVEPDKAASLGWFTLDALPEPMVPHEAHALAHLGSGAAYLTFGWDER